MRYVVALSVFLSVQVIADDSVTFEFVHGYERKAPTYRASTTDAEIIRKARAELVKPLKDRTLHIHGVLLEGHGDNAPWGWHFQENTWGLAFINAEYCDGDPILVEEHLSDWVKLGAYCPYAARVAKELKK